MTDGIVHDQRSVSPLPEGDTHLLLTKKRRLGVGVYWIVGLLVGMTGGVVGGFVGLILSEIVRVNFVPGLERANLEWYQTTEFLWAAVGFVFLGLVWAAVTVWLLARK